MKTILIVLGTLNLAAALLLAFLGLWLVCWINVGAAILIAWRVSLL